MKLFAFEIPTSRCDDLVVAVVAEDEQAAKALLLSSYKEDYGHDLRGGW